MSLYVCVCIFMCSIDKERNKNKIKGNKVIVKQKILWWLLYFRCEKIFFYFFFPLKAFSFVLLLCILLFIQYVSEGPKGSYQRWENKLKNIFYWHLFRNLLLATLIYTVLYQESSTKCIEKVVKSPLSDTRCYCFMFNNNLTFMVYSYSFESYSRTEQ